MAADQTLLGTVTGEPFQPVRLHYRMFDRRALLNALKKLRCVDHDPSRDRWVWLYEYEARDLQFKQAHAQIPEHLRPIVIGSFFVRGKDKLLLDLRSPERALAAIEFFDKHIPRSVARVTDAEVVNKLFSAEDATLTPDQIFNLRPGTVRDPEAALQGLVELTAGVADPREKLRIAAEQMEARAKEPLPEIERFPVHYYEDGIGGFRLALQVRQIIAMQHWLGNSEYTMDDAIKSVYPSM
jgi:hypothetical protein